MNSVNFVPGVHWVAVWDPPHKLLLVDALKEVTLSMYRTHVLLFPSLRNQYPLLLDISVLQFIVLKKNILSKVFHCSKNVNLFFVAPFCLSLKQFNEYLCACIFCLQIRDKFNLLLDIFWGYHLVIMSKGCATLFDI